MATVPLLPDMQRDNISQLSRVNSTNDAQGRGQGHVVAVEVDWFSHATALPSLLN